MQWITETVPCPLRSFLHPARVLLLAVVGLHLSLVQGYNTKFNANGWDIGCFQVPSSPSEKSLKEARLMKHKGQNKDVVSFPLWTHAQECQKLIGHLLPLDSQLIKPVQRILKYRLFLEVRTWATLLSFVLTNSNSKQIFGTSTGAYKAHG